MTTKRPPNPITEVELQQAILLAVGQLPYVRVWRQQTGQGWTQDMRRQIRFGVVGGGDASGLMADGRRIEIEVKVPGNYQSPEQKRFQAMINNFGGVYLVVHSVEEALRLVQQAWESSPFRARNGAST